jgi:hypothetical protein
MMQNREQDSQVNRIAQEVADLRAELVVMQAVVAMLAAELSRAAADPVEALGRVTTACLGFSDAAGRAIGGIGRPISVTGAALRFAEGAERFLHEPKSECLFPRS